jgi:hypothetical protein
LSPDDKTTIKIPLPFIDEDKSISTMSVDKTGHIYILSDLAIYKCIWQSQLLHLVECLGKIDILLSQPRMIVTNEGNDFYFSDIEVSYLYRWKKISV